MKLELNDEIKSYHTAFSAKSDTKDKISESLNRSKSRFTFAENNIYNYYLYTPKVAKACFFKVIGSHTF